MSSAALGACGIEEPAEEPVEEPAISETEQAGTQMQGTQMQGTQMQGTQMQGTQMQGFQLGAASLSGIGIDRLRIYKGEVIAERGGSELRGTALAGLELAAEVRRTVGGQEVTETAAFRIASVAPENPAYDPTNTGATYLYGLEQWVAETSSWVPACGPDLDGRRVAIPVAGTWNATGDRIESSTLFTFACTSGVIAKCYRWGYRPWLTGYGDIVSAHWACTRLARADYCGNGVPHTREGTAVNVWDLLPGAGPIQRTGLLPPIGMLFEAGWSTQGAVCLSHTRWLTVGTLMAGACPDRLILPGVGPLLCAHLSQVLSLDLASRPLLYNDSHLNLGLLQ